MEKLLTKKQRRISALVITAIIVVTFVSVCQFHTKATEKRSQEVIVMRLDKEFETAADTLQATDIKRVEKTIKELTDKKDIKKYSEKFKVIKKQQVKKENSNRSAKIDVPLLNQMDDPRLFNGCEVTSLAMMLNFNDINITKQQLAEAITTVPLEDETGLKGNPHEGFVGSVSGETPGLGVYHDPIAQLATDYVDSNRVKDISGKGFSNVIEALSEGQPVWVIVTSTFSPVTNMQTWETAAGPIDITYDMHSVVLTGFDKDNVYLNNPYGEKDQTVNRTDFIAAWKQMGSQAIYIKKTK